MRAAQAQLEAAQREYARSERLYAKKYISQAAMDQAESQFKSVNEIVAFYKKTFPEKLAALRALPAEKSTETLDFFGVMKMSRAQFIGFANNHSIHHRGQLAAYLRAMGSKVPNIYGPSADAEGV